jgi:hypothetical protein
MPDLVTSQVFTDGEKGITATKMNNIVGGSVIQPDFYNTKPSSPVIDPTDQLLELKSTGAYARITGAQLSASVANQLALADGTQNGMLRQVSMVSTDYIDGTNHCQPMAGSSGIALLRLRSFNGIGNSTFECDQRVAAAPLTNPADQTWLLDRFQLTKASVTASVNTALQRVPTAPIIVPGTSSAITQSFLRFTVAVTQGTLNPGTYYGFQQSIEGPRWRELAGDAHSIQLLVRSSVAGLAFSLALRDSGNAHCLTKLCTIPLANTWTLVQLPNIPIWVPAGNWTCAPGVLGYNLGIYLAAGSNFTPPANDTWQNGNLFGAIGAGNFLATVGATFDIAYLGHEPGPLCTLPQDRSFTDDYDENLRYFTMSYDYGVSPGTIANNGASFLYVPGSSHPIVPNPFKKPMARTPTVTGYSSVTGVVGAVRDTLANADRAISTTQGLGTSGFSGFILTSTNAASALYGFHYTADTGW